MKTISEIMEGLQQAIPQEAIHPPDKSAGIFGEYVTAQWAMQEANAVFGVDGVADFEIVDDKVIELPVAGQTNGNWVYITTVKITFAAIDSDHDRETFFSRIGRGVGVASAPSGGARPATPQQLDTAAKAALSDAIKNALMRTGQRLGAQLYFDERMAQVLGYEIESSRESGATTQASADSDDLEELGAVVCKYGYGKEGPDGKKKFQDWTIKAIYDDPEGKDIIRWIFDTDAKGWFNDRLRKYAELMMEQASPDSATDDTITIWTGEKKNPNEYPDWDKLITNRGFNELVANAFNADGKIANFGPMHKRMINHYKSHFGVSSVRGLTWQMLNAFVARCKDGEDAAAFGYPEYYGDEAEAEANADAQRQTNPPPDSLFEDAHSSPSIAIGPRQNQKVPSDLQTAVVALGIEKPDEWLWSNLMSETPVGEWKPEHTDLALRIISSIKEGKVDKDATVVSTMWSFGLGQLQS